MRKLAIGMLWLVACGGGEEARVPAPGASASAGATPVVAQPKATARTLAADEQVKTAAGAPFTAPKDWSILVEAPTVTLFAPEKDTKTKLGVVDVASAKDADDAVASAWRAFEPEQKHALKMATPRPGRDGWEEQKTYVYETSPNERRVIVAVARRKGAAWTVLLLDGDEGIVEKRGSQIDRFSSSMRPAGFERESFAGKKPHDLDKAAVAKIVDTVETARKLGDVPGVGLALVQNGKVVYAGGLGVREIGKPEKVDENTRFMIASNTKALTTLMLAKLVDEGKLRWDQPVVEVDPTFKLGDPEITKQVLVRHLICACTGMPRQDLEWLFEYKDRTPASTMQTLGTMKPTSKFGEVFQYSNTMAAAAGFVGGKVAYPGKELGLAYDEAMKSRVFAPLGMTDTTFDFATALRANHATAYGYDIDGKTRPAKFDVDYSVVPVRPAGGAWSTARDVAKYVLMELASGKLPDGKPYIGETALLARRKTQIVETDGVDYGMGLMIDSRYKVTVIHHGGDLIGYHSDMFFLPEANVGGVILTNADAGPALRRAFVRRTLEVLFDGKDEAAEDAKTELERMQLSMKTERERLTLPAEKSVVDGLAATYKSPELGSITIKKNGQRLLLDFGEYTTEAATRKNDDGTYELYSVEPGLVGIELVVAKDAAGRRTLVIRDAQHEYVFSETK